MRSLKSLISKEYEEENMPCPLFLLKALGAKLSQAEEKKIRHQESIKSGLNQIKLNIKNNGFHISKKGNRITSLGNPENLTRAGVEKSVQVRKLKARNNPNNKRAFAILELLILQEMTLKKMAIHLNQKGFLTVTGKAFTPMGVSNLLKLYSISRLK